MYNQKHQIFYSSNFTFGKHSSNVAAIKDLILLLILLNNFVTANDIFPDNQDGRQCEIGSWVRHGVHRLPARGHSHLMEG